MNNTDEQKIRLKVMCLFIHRGKVLASKGYDDKKGETFYRLIGGGVNFGEECENAIRREVKEELKCEVLNLSFLKTIENIFVFNGNRGHDVVFIYKGELSDKSLYKKEKIHIVEPYSEFNAEWVSIDDILSGQTILYPAADYSALLKTKHNYAFIDGANLYNAMIELKWNLDYKKFRIWLKDKYSVNKAYIFIGFLEKRQKLYNYLKSSGFDLVFKEVTYDNSGKPKGNCDADLVLHSIIEFYKESFDKAVIISSDGDYAGLVKFLMKNQKMEAILSPNLVGKCSVLLKRTEAKIAYINDQRNILENKNEKAPDGDGTP